jgi:hypothetical protein
VANVGFDDEVDLQRARRELSLIQRPPTISR